SGQRPRGHHPEPAQEAHQRLRAQAGRPVSAGTAAAGAGFARGACWWGRRLMRRACICLLLWACSSSPPKSAPAAQAPPPPNPRSAAAPPVAAAALVTARAVPDGGAATEQEAPKTDPNVHITIRTTPAKPKAKVFWGKKLLGETPLIFERPRD